MSRLRPNPDGLHPIVELNFKGVFLINPISYIHGINFTFNDPDFSGMTYGECITFLERFMQESIKKLYYCEPGIEDWFGSEIEEEDGDDSCIDGGKNEEEIDNLTDVDVDFSEVIVTMNRTKGDELLNRLCGEEEEGNDNNIDDDDDDDGNEEDANVTQQHSIFKELIPWKKQFPILGDEVHEGDQEVNDDGGAVNDGGQAVNEVHVQQDYDEVELTPLEFDTSANGKPSQVHVQEHEARETPVATLLKKIRRKKSERIIKLKLGKKVGGADAPGNSEAKPVTLE
ncbi:unnamed protein product [Lactuca virosa]|uniref:FACT complex subunit n=1 Tax=Lactuca virosa TaxID=75947 RepID=A0AAU9LD79_9ASTR|nr:unnamed protein product [Lactuca virosa]